MKQKCTVLVTGITRSGLSLTMQMLHAGGFATVGDYPAFEPYPCGSIPWQEIGGRAVKVVDMQRQFPPPGDYSVIRLRRDLKEQANSINKWNQAFGLPAMPRSPLIGSLRRDYRMIDRWIRNQIAPGRSFLMEFENLIRDPYHSASLLEEFVGQRLDIEAMAKTVRSRSVGCYPGLLEAELVG